MNESNKDLTIYHGSRGGIDGDIRPESRKRCDFGSGFYMGTNAEQAKGLVIEDAVPMLYTIRFKLSEIPENRILRLDGMEWVYMVLANRGKVKEFNDLSLCKNTLAKAKDYDVIIGPIADDRMNEALRRFEEYTMTDKALEACLRSVDYGVQIVAKTQAACNQIEVLSERDLYGKEADDVRAYVQRTRAENRDIITRMQLQYQREGRFLNEIVEQEKNMDLYAGVPYYIPGTNESSPNL